MTTILTHVEWRTGNGGTYNIPDGTQAMILSSADSGLSSKVNVTNYEIKEPKTGAGGYYLVLFTNPSGQFVVNTSYLSGLCTYLG